MPHHARLLNAEETQGGRLLIPCDPNEVSSLSEWITFTFECKEIGVVPAVKAWLKEIGLTIGGIMKN